MQLYCILDIKKNMHRSRGQEILRSRGLLKDVTFVVWAWFKFYLRNYIVVCGVTVELNYSYWETGFWSSPIPTFRVKLK